MSQRVAVIGLGHVGAVAAACLAHRGHRVIAIDRDVRRVAAVEAGHAPVQEPRLEERIAAACRSGRLRATTSVEGAVPLASATLLCVGTPIGADGRADLRDLARATRQLGDALRRTRVRHVVVIRSTVPPGTTESVAEALAERSGLVQGRDFGVCVEPEFLREGNAVADFESPDAVVIGETDRRDGDVALTLAAPHRATRITRCAPAEAELLKYLHNAWNALRVSFANEVDALAAPLGLDGATILGAFAGNATGAISGRYLAPGAPWGGACLGKDLEALRGLAASQAVAAPLLEGVARSNEAHLDRCVERVLAYGVARIGVVGLAFKPGIADLRDSPFLALAQRLAAGGAQVRVFDARVAAADLDPAWQARRCDTIGALAGACDLLVLCHGDSATRRALARDAARLACVDLTAQLRVAAPPTRRSDDVAAA
jgi:GDP-mannose 6-dehydrogenase